MLGNEAIQVLEVMRSEGMPMAVHDPLFEVVINVAGLEVKAVKDQEVKVNKRCTWWNRGYCHEKGGCSYAHPKEDCQDHLQDGCKTKGCNNLRPRKKCKYFNTDEGCHRRENCEYLHVLDNTN